jgi:ABC-type nickel/cobalt efflux system permease component RcnA
LLTSPLDQRAVSFNVAPVTSPGQPTTQPAIQLSRQFVEGRNDAFTQLITLQNLTLPTLLVALVVAFVWGGMHAMSPGHGKTVVGAYLVGSRGTAWHALFLGLTTTITHTAGVFALGLVTLFASQFIVPEQLYPWLSFLSGLLVMAIGLNLFVSRLRSAGLVQTLKVSETFRVSPTHDHEHHHHHHHDHDHEHDHSHHDHSHLPPGVDGSPVTWRSLLALGITGGLLPCPSALIVLLSAIALGRIGFGLVLVLVFSLGLAGVLTAIGLLFVYAGRLFERAPSHNRVMRWLPVVSALFITLAGLGITARALLETGLI